VLTIIPIIKNVYTLGSVKQSPQNVTYDQVSMCACFGNKNFFENFKRFFHTDCKLYYTLLFTKITNILLTDNMHKRTKLSNRNRRIIRHINTIVHIQVQIIRVHTDSHRHSSHIPMLNRQLIHSLIQLPTLG